MTDHRDIRKKPYTKNEQRVCDYLQEIAPMIGCGDDPVGFLIASHRELRIQLNKFVKRNDE